MKQSYNFKNIFLLIILGFLSLFTNQLFSQQTDQQENSVKDKIKFYEKEINQNLVEIRNLIDNEVRAEKFRKELLETIYIKAEHDIPNVNIKALLFDKKEFNVKNLNNKELTKTNDFIELVLEKIKKL